MAITGNDLFSKDESNLSRSALKHAKKKKELERLIESNLPFLVEYYFGNFYKKEEREKYEDIMTKLLGSDKYFIQPLKKLIKKSKKEDGIKIPSGLSTMLMDNLDEVKKLYRQHIQRAGSTANLSEEAQDHLNTIKELSNYLIKETTDICNKLNKKRINKLIKIGFTEEYAKTLARSWVPSKYLNSYNIRRYLYRFNTTLYDIQKNGLKEDPNKVDKGLINEIGVNLTDPNTIKDIYELIFKGLDRKVFISGLVGIMLERKGERYKSFSKHELSCFNAISTLILDILEGKEYLNTSKEKLSKKDKKELVLDKKELKHFIETYSEERIKDQNKGRDSARRVSFTNLNENEYPRIIKVFKKCNKSKIDEMFEPHGIEKTSSDKKK